MGTVVNAFNILFYRRFRPEQEFNHETQTIERSSTDANLHTFRSNSESMNSTAIRKHMTENSKLKRKLITQRRSNLDLRRQIQKLKKHNLRLGNRLNRMRGLETLELNVRHPNISHASAYII